VFVSTAAGAVGSVAAQIAKARGCYVVGSTGSDDKAAWLKDVAGLDAVINYKTQPLAKALAEATPKGIDVYFENVGGAHLDAALPRMNVRGRIPVCGMISTYNGGGDGVRQLSNMIYKRVRMEGFVASDFGHLNAAFVADMTGWLKSGQVKYQETVLDGFERAPEGLIGLFDGRNAGKMIIRVAE
jgi:NADPH-dependent curcumin reductase CurA